MNSSSSSNTADMSHLPNLTTAKVPNMRRLPCLKLSDPEIQNKKSVDDHPRVFTVTYRGEEHIMKIFQHRTHTEPIEPRQDLLKSLSNEIKAYELLKANDSAIGPNMVALLCRDDGPNKVIGFMCEKIKGKKFNDRRHWKIYQEEIEKLHACGFIHGDLPTGKNILVTEQGGLKFFDFEFASFEDEFQDKIQQKRFEELKQDEMRHFQAP